MALALGSTTSSGLQLPTAPVIQVIVGHVGGMDSLLDPSWHVLVASHQPQTWSNKHSPHVVDIPHTLASHSPEKFQLVPSHSTPSNPWVFAVLFCEKPSSLPSKHKPPLELNHPQWASTMQSPQVLKSRQLWVPEAPPATPAPSVLPSPPAPPLAPPPSPSPLPLPLPSIAFLTFSRMSVGIGSTSNSPGLPGILDVGGVGLSQLQVHWHPHPQSGGGPTSGVYVCDRGDPVSGMA